MVYVERNAQADIIAIYKEPRPNAVEALSPDSTEVIEFINMANTNFNHSDTALIRVIEDVVDVLISKNLLRLTDLPVAAQEKLLSRKTLRQRLSNSLDLLVDSDQGLL
ncbi:hypothetical protein HZU75_01885 [Chitinibacter fontanus]|uniref:Tryptophan synthase subunit beta like protein n=1 Tax=Chitinibacter fontanus TaxID=1737446 RepID=A0A7D5Z9J9_9NEIS|nr:hypothetical protein [Chitinibacter fontanus]QLI80386.1 hypothetical protein HZU75_01885 [Chitinibacter fontanus]